MPIRRAASRGVSMLSVFAMDYIFSTFRRRVPDLMIQTRPPTAGELHECQLLRDRDCRGAAQDHRVLRQNGQNEIEVVTDLYLDEASRVVDYVVGGALGASG